MRQLQQPAVPGLMGQVVATTLLWGLQWGSLGCLLQWWRRRMRHLQLQAMLTETVALWKVRGRMERGRVRLGQRGRRLLLSVGAAAW